MDAFRLLTMGLCLLLLGAAAPKTVVPDEDMYRIKLQGIRAGDHAGLLKLGAWCEQRRQFQWARTCYRRVVELGPSPSFVDANYNLARMEIELGKPALALPRLRLNATKHDDARARELLKKLEDDTSRAQKKLLAEADAALEAGRYEEARQGYAEAIKEYQQKQLAGPLVQEEDILPKAAACRAALDAAFREREGLSRAAVPVACAACRANKTPGFTACTACEGAAGKKKCAACGGLGAKLCDTCLGMTQHIDDAGLDALLGKFRRALENPEVKTLDLRPAAQRLEAAILEASPRDLLFLARLTPAWESFPLPGGKSLAAPLPQKLDAELAKWWLDTTDWRTRAAVLLGWACRYARTLAAFEAFRARAKPLYTKPDPERLKAVPAEPALRLAAYPESRIGQFIALEATLAKLQAGEYVLEGTLAGTEPAALKVVCWQSALKPVFGRLAVGPWRSRVGHLETMYPFDTSRRFAKTPTDFQVLLCGRLLRMPQAEPATVLELWDFEPLYPAKYAPFVAQLSTTVDIALRDVKLEELLSIAETILGLTIATDGVPADTWLVLIAQGSTAGRMFAEVADVLGAALYLRDDRLCLGTRAPRADADAMRQVLSYIKRRDASFLVAGKGTPRAADTAAQGAPIDDPLAAYRESAAAMAYRDAVMHLMAVRSRLKGEEKNGAYAKEMAAAELGDLLTGQVPVSSFARGKDLARVRIRDRQGKEGTQFVRVLERGEKGIRVETSFGSSFFVPAAQIAGEEKVSPQAWRDMMAAHLKTRTGEAGALAGRAKAAELLSLAVLAKTGGFLAEGHAYVEQLLASPDFAWVLENLFPEDKEKGLASWALLGGAPRAAGKPPKTVGRNEPRKGATAAATPPPGKELPRDPAALRAFAVAQLAAGKEHIRNYRRRAGDAGKEWKAAVDSLRLAREAFAAHLERDANDQEARRLLEDAALLFESCVKDTPFLESADEKGGAK
jgi:hypothetical protein